MAMTFDPGYYPQLCSVQILGFFHTTVDFLMVILKGMPAWCAGWAKEQYHSGVIIRQPPKSFYVPFRSVVAYYTREISASASLETTMEGTVFSQHCINMA